MSCRLSELLRTVKTPPRILACHESKTKRAQLVLLCPEDVSVAVIFAVAASVVVWPKVAPVWAAGPQA